MMALTTSDMCLMNLPIEMVDNILSYLSYDQIAKLRSVNRMFNTICSDKLNKGFMFVNQFHSRCMRAVKTKLPRRESERRHHPLARHSDILMAVETRLSMLSMTFSKYIEAHQCCFIPGKVLDEALKVLRIVNNCSTPLQSNGNFPLLPRPHDFLQEYRDVSSMAMEHFDEKILPSIKETMRLQNPRLYCFKSKPDSSRIIVPAVDTLEGGSAIFRGTCYKLEPVASTSAGASGSAENNKCAQKKKESDAQANKLHSATMLRLYRRMRRNKIEYRSIHLNVEKVHRNVQRVSKKMKLENVMLRQQMAQQKVMIKHLRRELRETRAAMNVMSKDLNQLKIEQTPSRGTKRKQENCDEDCDV